MTITAERDSVEDQLCARIDELEAEKEALASQLDRAEEERDYYQRRGDRVAEERDVLVEQVAYWRERAEGAVAERDALAAHVSILESIINVSNLTDRTEFMSALNSAPTTSLSRLKAQCRRDVVARLAEEFREAWPEHNGKHAWILGAGEDICRQAEGGEDEN